MARRNYSFDANMLLSDGISAITTAGYAQVNGAQGIIDLGGNQGITITLPSISVTPTLTPQQARIDLVAVIYISAMTLAGSDVYKLIMVGSNNPSFASGNVILGEMEFGEAAGKSAPNTINDAAPGTVPAGNQFELLFTNEYNSTPFEYISMYVAGTFGSITFTAFAAVLPRI